MHPTETKTCSKCSGVKLLADFHKRKGSRDGRYSMCKACTAEKDKAYWHANKERKLAQAKAWRAANPERVKEASEAWDARNPDKARGAWLRRYWPGAGWKKAVENFETMFAAQGGTCAVCKSKPEKKHDLHVDHDHSTGAVRGLLCRSCNVTLMPAVEHHDHLVDSARAYLARGAS